MQVSRFIRLVAAAVLLLCAVPAIADDWYAVEVIVFQHRDDATSAGERFPRNPGHPDLDQAASLAAPTDPRTLRSFEQLPPQALRMGGALRTLERSSRYEPLVHFGWMQPGLSREQAIAVRVALDAGRPLPAEPLVIELPDEPAQAPEPAIDFLEDPDADEVPEFDTALPFDDEINPWWLAEQLRATHAAPPVRERLQGTLTLILQRFLHIDADLVLTSAEPLPEIGGDSRDWFTRREDILTALVHEQIGLDEAQARMTALDAEPRTQAYRLRESRRVRSGELHYFDHPKVGVVAMVWPVPREEVDARRQAYDDAYERALLQRGQ